MEAICTRALTFIFLICFSGTTLAQDQDRKWTFTLAGDATMVSKYIWRGQRLTNDWSLQPSATVGIENSSFFENFSFNVWGSMDLTAANAGTAVPLPQDPLAPEGASGLKGKFSEIDYTFSFSHDFERFSVDLGSIFYTFPERSDFLPSTTELYGGISFDSIRLAPSATLYIDVDESRSSGDTGMYFLLAAGDSFDLSHKTFPSLDWSTSLSFVNCGFGEFYYGAREAGAHDFNLTISLPIILGEKWSAGTFISYSALLGKFRDFQFQDSREVLLGTSGSPATLADTVVGGFTLVLPF